MSDVEIVPLTPERWRGRLGFKTVARRAPHRPIMRYTF